MRIWDIEPEKLCRNHLLGEHRELHAIWSVITNNKKGYSKHPETLRWIGKLKALYNRHGEQVAEMTRRGFKHKSDLDKRLARGKHRQEEFVDTVKKQQRLLKSRKCGCKV